MVLEVSEDYFTETEEKDVKQRTGTVNCMIVTLILCVVSHAGRLAPNFPDQRALLTEEGVAFRDNGCVDMKKHQWNE